MTCKYKHNVDIVEYIHPLQAVTTNVAACISVCTLQL